MISGRVMSRSRLPCHSHSHKPISNCRWVAMTGGRGGGGGSGSSSSSGTQQQAMAGSMQAGSDRQPPTIPDGQADQGRQACSRHTAGSGRQVTCSRQAGQVAVAVSGNPTSESGSCGTGALGTHPCLGL